MIYTFSFYPIDSRMYVMIEEEKALVVDPCVSEEALELLQEHTVKDILVLLTHEHYDHVSGVNWLREKCVGTHVLCSESCAYGIAKVSENLSRFWEVLFMDKDEETRKYAHNMNVQPYSCEADDTFSGEHLMRWEGHSIFLKETPGHSKGSTCILLDNEILFSGDSLVTGHPTITRLPGGSKKIFKEKTIPYLQSLDRGIMVYPGHGEPQRLGEYFKTQKRNTT